MSLSNDVISQFAKTVTGTISGLTLTSADVVAKRIIATKEISLSCKNTADVERVLYYDGTSVRVGKLLNAAGAQSGAGFEFFDKTITMYGSLNLYSGDITTIINGITVETYNASVSETNPESMYINQSTVNHEMRKANRAQCRKDRDEFEELAYSIQDEIISKVATAKED